MTRLHLVEPFDGGPVPEYRMHDGRPVTWRPWKRALPLMHVRLSCGVCGDVDVWSTSGLTAPPADGFMYGIDRDVAALPVFRLFGFRCGACGDTTVFDTGESGAEWAEVDLTQGVLW